MPHAGRLYPLSLSVRIFSGNFPYPGWFPRAYLFEDQGWGGSHHHPPTNTIVDSGDPVWVQPDYHMLYEGIFIDSGDTCRHVAQFTFDANHINITGEYRFELNGVLQMKKPLVSTNPHPPAAWFTFPAPAAGNQEAGATLYPNAVVTVTAKPW